MSDDLRKSDQYARVFEDPVNPAGPTKSYWLTLAVRVTAPSPQIARNSVEVKQIGSGTIHEWWVSETEEDE